MTVQSSKTDGPNRAVSTHERREAILDAALSLFAEFGVEGTSMKMLAQRAGISTGLTYHYFKNKAELLDQVFESRGPVFPDLLSRHHESVDVVLPDFCREFGTSVRKNLDVVWLFYKEYRSSKAVASGVRKRREACLGSLADYLRARQEAGEVREVTPLVASRGLLGSLFQLHLTEEPSDQFVGELVEIFLTGIKA